MSLITKKKKPFLIFSGPHHFREAACQNTYLIAPFFIGSNQSALSFVYLSHVPVSKSHLTTKLKTRYIIILVVVGADKIIFPLF
jgi:hypothetical protein